MKHKKGLIWMIIGGMLLLAAVFLVLYNLSEDRRAKSVSAGILSELKASLPEPKEPADPPEPTEDLFSRYEQEDEAIPEETLIEIDGQFYLGYITLPTLGIELPVLSEWSYPNLKIAPCRYQGSVYTGDLILAAHNYSSHFGSINQLNSGDRIIFTDGNGVAHQYAVIQSEILEPTNIEAMEFGSAEHWDLTLFTCTIGGQSRVTVRAIAVD